MFTKEEQKTVAPLVTPVLGRSMEKKSTQEWEERRKDGESRTDNVEKTRGNIVLPKAKIPREMNKLSN